MDTKPFLPRCTHGQTPPCCRRNSSIKAFPIRAAIKAGSPCHSFTFPGMPEQQPYPLICRRRAATYCWASFSAIPVPNSNGLPSGCSTTILFSTLLFCCILLASMEMRESFARRNCWRRPRLPTPAEQLSRSGRQGQRHTAEQHINGAQKRTEPDQNERNQEQLPE